MLPDGSAYFYYASDIDPTGGTFNTAFAVLFLSRASKPE